MGILVNLFRKKYWVYEKDTFMGIEITPKKAFRTKFWADIHHARLRSMMRALAQYVSHDVIEVRKNETFPQAYKRKKGRDLDEIESRGKKYKIR
jgi:hypothetical protein